MERKSVCLIFLLAFGLSFLRASELTEKPNIIVILTDDQDVVLKGLIPMTATQQLIGFKGATFMNAFTSSPICCPSRASILSGQYAHNHATINNSEAGGCYGSFWRDKVEPRALPVQLNNHGYETFFAGKYLNEYHGKEVPPGWDHFFGLHGNSKYYNYSLNENGETISYGDEYLTDVLSDKMLDFLHTRSQDQPFFAMIAPPAPHAPYTPAPRHNQTFEGVKALRTLNFNTISGPLDKHWLLTMKGQIPQTKLSLLDIYYRKRWQSLLAVDELVENIIHYLRLNDLLSNTYIVFTSDNGYHLGQFSQPFDKRQPYETDIRVPFLVRGPGIPAKIVCSAPIVLIDLFPTILEWAGAPFTGYEDGKSFNHYISSESNHISNNFYQRQILIEYWGEGNKETYNPACPWSESDGLAGCTVEGDCHCQDSWNNTYSCIRHFARNTNKLYCEFRDTEEFIEAYDLHLDTYQMNNLGYEMLPSELAMYALSLKNLTKCIGNTCRVTRF